MGEIEQQIAGLDVEVLITQLTLEEKIALTAGKLSPTHKTSTISH